MAKKRTKKQKQQLLFKALLSSLLMLLILLIWVGSSKDAASQLSAIVPANEDTANPDDIGKIISPMLKKEVMPADEVFVLTFEDELPDPVSSDIHKQDVNKVGDRHVLSIVIDDVGYDMQAFERLLALPYPMTMSVLPDSPHAEQAARMAHQHGLEVMLHMPMQTANPKYQQKMERFYLHKDMTKQQFTEVFEAALAKVPYVKGVNNHMGSLLTEDKKSMKWMMELCRKHGLFFIDSRTSAASVAAATAQESGILWNARDIFLDHSTEQDKLKHAWKSAMACTSRNDHCIMLGHPHKETVAFLEDTLPAISTHMLVPIQEVLRNP